MKSKNVGQKYVVDVKLAVVAALFIIATLGWIVEKYMSWKYFSSDRISDRISERIEAVERRVEELTTKHNIVAGYLIRREREEQSNETENATSEE